VPRGQRDGSLRQYSIRFSRQEPLLFYQVAPQLYSRGWMDPVPDPLLFFSGGAGNRTRASGSVAKNFLASYEPELKLPNKVYQSIKCFLLPFVWVAEAARFLVTALLSWRERVQLCCEIKTGQLAVEDLRTRWHMQAGGQAAVTSCPSWQIGTRPSSYSSCCSFFIIQSSKHWTLCTSLWGSKASPTHFFVHYFI
jgi:hypothetical protein